MITGTVEPRDVKAKLATLERGWREGNTKELPIFKALESQGSGFRRMTPLPTGHKTIVSRLFGRSASINKAAQLSTTQRVSVFSFSLTPVRHHMRFMLPGIWVQTGGQFGRSTRESRWFSWCRFAGRVKQEMSRVAKQRGLEVD